MPNYDLNGNPLPDNTPGGGAPSPQQSQPPQQQQYDLAGNPIPPQQSGGGQYGQPPPPQGQYGQPQQPYGQQPPPYGQQPGVWPPPTQYGREYTRPYYTLDPSADKLLGYSILAFFCFGIILGPYSAFKASQGIAEINAGRVDPADKGKLVGAMVCGILAGIAHVLVIFARVGAMTQTSVGH